MTNKKLLDQIRRYAEAREDLLSSESPYDGSELLIVQIRRCVKFEVINPGGWQPHEKKSWLYYSAPILIDTRVTDKLTKKQMENRDFARIMGMEWFGVTALKDLEKVLGLQQEWTKDSARPEKP